MRPTLLTAAAALEAELAIEGASEPFRATVRRGLVQLADRSVATFGDVALDRLPALLAALGSTEPTDGPSALEWLAARFLDVFLRWLRLPDGDSTPLLGTI